MSQLRDSLYIYIFFRKRKQENKRKQLKQCKSCEVIQIRTYRTSINNISQYLWFDLIVLTSIFCKALTDWLATGIPLISLISSPTWRVACLCIIPPCIIRATTHFPSSFIFKVIPCNQTSNAIFLSSFLQHVFFLSKTNFIYTKDNKFKKFNNLTTQI